MVQHIEDRGFLFPPLTNWRYLAAFFSLFPLFERGNKIAATSFIMGMESYRLGKIGEEAAEKYLVCQGYEILERNYRSKQGEIDLIAREGGFLVFVEIKNYSFRSYGLPVGAVGINKRGGIIHAARFYLYKNKIKGINCRFDVLTIYCGTEGSRAIELYKNAFKVN